MVTQTDIDYMLTQRGIPITAESRLEERISIAANIGLEYGSTGGKHHKQWVITQMLRALLKDDEQYIIDEDWDEGIAP